MGATIGTGTATLSEHLNSPPVRGTRSLVFLRIFVDRGLSFFFWPLCCLSHLDLLILIWYFQTLFHICVKFINILIICYFKTFWVLFRLNKLTKKLVTFLPSIPQSCLLLTKYKRVFQTCRYFPPQ